MAMDGEAMGARRPRPSTRWCKRLICSASGMRFGATPPPASFLQPFGRTCTKVAGGLQKEDPRAAEDRGVREEFNPRPPIAAAHVGISCDSGGTGYWMAIGCLRGLQTRDRPDWMVLLLLQTSNAVRETTPHVDVGLQGHSSCAAGDERLFSFCIRSRLRTRLLCCELCPRGVDSILSTRRLHS